MRGRGGVRGEEEGCEGKRRGVRGRGGVEGKRRGVRGRGGV